MTGLPGPAIDGRRRRRPPPAMHRPRPADSRRPIQVRPAPHAAIGSFEGRRSLPRRLYRETRHDGVGFEEFTRNLRTRGRCGLPPLRPWGEHFHRRPQARTMDTIATIIDPPVSDEHTQRTRFGAMVLGAIGVV